MIIISKKYISTLISIGICITLCSCSIDDLLKSSSSQTDNQKSQTKQSTTIQMATPVEDVVQNDDIIKKLINGDTCFKSKGSPKQEPEALKKITDTKYLKEDALTVKNDDYSIFRVYNGGKLSLSQMQIISTSKATDPLESRFYGVAAAILCEPRSNITIDKSEISTNNSGSSGVFAYGNNSSVNISNSTISTSANNSSGISTSYKGSVFMNNSNITTDGQLSPCVNIGRNNGTITVTGGKLLSYNVASPIAYSCGNLSITGSEGTSAQSECGVIEGKSSLNITDCVLNAEQSNAFKLYQSNSGDTLTGKTNLNIVSGKISSLSGATFYVSNTEANIHLQFAEIENNGVLLKCSKDIWGKSPANGGKTVLFADSQKLSGDIYCGQDSSVTLKIMNGSVYKGAVNTENLGKDVNVMIDATSTWELTSDCYLSSISNTLEKLSNINDNGHNIYYDAENSNNKWLKERVIKMQGGGSLMPVGTRIDVNNNSNT